MSNDTILSIVPVLDDHQQTDVEKGSPPFGGRTDAGEARESTIDAVDAATAATDSRGDGQNSFPECAGVNFEEWLNEYLRLIGKGIVAAYQGYSDAREEPLQEGIETAASFMDFLVDHIGFTDEWPIELTIAPDFVKECNRRLAEFKDKVYSLRVQGEKRVK